MLSRIQFRLITFAYSNHSLDSAFKIQPIVPLCSYGLNQEHVPWTTTSKRCPMEGSPLLYANTGDIEVLKVSLETVPHGAPRKDPFEL